MNASELIDIVEDKVQDSTYGRTTHILPLLNEAILSAAALVALPSTITIGSLSISSGDVSLTLPEDFFRRIISCVVYDDDITDATIVNIIPDFASLIAKYPGLNSTGNPKDCYLAKTKLYIQPSPESDLTARIIYTATPTLIEEDSEDDEGPIDFPEELQRQILTSYAVAKIMDEIEDGMEASQKVETIYHNSQFYEGIGKLKALMGVEIEQPDFIEEERDGLRF